MKKLSKERVVLKKLSKRTHLLHQSLESYGCGCWCGLEGEMFRAAWTARDNYVISSPHGCPTR